MKIIFIVLITVSFVNFIDTRSCDAPPSKIYERELYCLDSFPKLKSAVRVRYNSEWMPICANVWPKTGADTVCMRLHGSYANSAEFEPISDSTVEFAEINWDCIETCIDCTRCIKPIKADLCKNMARVDCQDIRLVFKKEERNRKGMLQSYINNEWGSVCPLMWDMAEADVACNQIYSCPAKSALSQTTYNGFNASSQPINVRFYVCTGDEESLDNCTVKYKPTEEESIMCQNGDTRRAGVFCRTNCTRPIYTENVSLEPDLDDYEPFEQVKITCAPGYQPETGSSVKTLTCQSNCRWVGPTIDCKPVCDPPPEVQNATFLPVLPFYFVGDTVNYACHERYQLMGASSLTCKADQKWSNMEPECIYNIEAIRDKVGGDDSLGPFPAVVASIVMGAALAIAIIFFFILVVRRAREPIEYDESIPDDMSQKENEYYIEDL